MLFEKIGIFSETTVIQLQMPRRKAFFYFYKSLLNQIPFVFFDLTETIFFLTQLKFSVNKQKKNKTIELSSGSL